MVADALFSSEMDTWLTPDEILDPVREVYGEDGIGLDPCSHPKSIVGAKVSFTGPDHGGKDGLAESWGGYGPVWSNPPYGRVLLPAFAKKTAVEISKGVEVTSLIPARVETNWWRTFHGTMLVWVAWDGRVKFLDPEAQAKHELLEGLRRNNGTNTFRVTAEDYRKKGNLLSSLVKSKVVQVIDETTMRDELFMRVTPTGMEKDFRKASSAAFPSAVVYTGPRMKKFVEVFSKLGRVYYPGNA